MLMPIPTCIVITQVLVISKAAPKLGSIFYDPLSVSSNTNGKFNLNSRHVQQYYPNPPIIKRRDLNDNDEGNTQVPCHGYEFDEMKCKIVNNRVLCGYNKNNGKVKNSAEVVDMGNGCRMRNNRIECGYMSGPIDGSVLPRKEKLFIIKSKPTRTLSKNTIINKLTSLQTNTESTKRTPDTTSTTVATTKDTTKLDISTTASETVVKDSSDKSVTKEFFYKVIHQDATPGMLRNDKPIVLLRKRIMLIAMSTPKSTKTTISEVTGASAATASSTDTTQLQNETTGDEVNSTQNSKQEKVNLSEKSSEKNFTEGESTDKPPPLCIDKEDRIVCYDTAKFILFKKPTNSS